MRIMKNEVFNFGIHEVRVVISDNNEPMFVAKDVCDVLGYKNSPDAISKHCKIEGVANRYIPHPQSQTKQIQIIAINESNLYRLIMRSNKKEALDFQSWVCDEVLPSIRKHGAYMTDNTLEDVLKNPDLLIGLANQLKEERQQKELLRQQTELQERELRISAPKVEYFDTVLQSNSTYVTTLIAKELGLSATALNRKLCDLKIQFKQNEAWVLYAKYQNLGYTKTTTSTYTDSQGVTRTSMLTVWTEKGRKFIHEILADYHSVNPKNQAVHEFVNT